MYWIGTATETMVSPSLLIRAADCVCPFSAAATSGTDFPSTSQGSLARGRDGVAKKFRTTPVNRSNSPRRSAVSGKSERTTAPCAESERESSSSRPSLS